MAGLRTVFLTAGFLAAAFGAGGFFAGAGIFIPGIPGMCWAAAGMASARALVAARAASSRFMPRLRAGGR
ncbi:MAG: hypothetical protein ABIS51_15865 [Sphingomonas sp.]